MSVSQERVLHALGHGSMTALSVAIAVDGQVRLTQRTLDALYRRSWVTVTPEGRWCVTERGRKKIGVVA